MENQRQKNMEKRIRVNEEGLKYAYYYEVIVKNISRMADSVRAARSAALTDLDIRCDKEIEEEKALKNLHSDWEKTVEYLKEQWSEIEENLSLIVIMVSKSDYITPPESDEEAR